MATKTQLIAWRNRGYDEGISAKSKEAGLAAAFEYGGVEARREYLKSYKRGEEERLRLAGNAPK